MKIDDFKGRVRKETVSKYTTLIKSALIKIDKDPNFDTLLFCRNNNVTTLFFKGLEELKYIARCKVGKFVKCSVIIPSSIITEKDGLELAAWVLKYNYSKKSPEDRPNYIKDQEVKSKVQEIGLEKMIEEKLCTQPPSTSREQRGNFLLKICKDLDLIEELKRRGYTGKLSKTQTLEF